jgi:ubiquinone/menaquinone biosynthesis C-methylase UbiE
MKTYLQESFDIDDKQLVSVIDELQLWAAPFGLRLLDTIIMKKNINILDVGSGMGFPLIEIAQRYGTSCKVYGIDPWSAALDRSKKKARAYGVKNISFVLGIAEKMPFTDEMFDLIVSNNGMNNVQELSKSFEECYRVCKPGGQMVFTFNLPETMNTFYEIFGQVLQEKELFRERVAMYEHIKAKRKSIDEMKRLVGSIGFSIKSVKTDNYTWHFNDAHSFFNHFFIKLAFMGPWKALLQKTQVVPVFEKVEKRLNQIALENGELNIEVPFAVFDCRKEL